VTVGTDGSRWGEAALRWAARHAWERGSELLVVSGEDAPSTRRITCDFPLLTVRIRATAEAPVAALVEASRESELLVLGCRGNRRRHLGLGSLVLPAVGAAECDTVVVRGADNAVDGRHRRVTAMISGGDEDASVVAHAADIALDRRCELRVLHAEPDPLTHHPISPERDSRAVLAAAEAHVGTLARRPVTVIEMVRAYAHEAVAACTDSDLLVVGRGASGAVTKTALHHAPCPVMVVHTVGVSPSPSTPGIGLATWSPCLPWPRGDRAPVHLERTTTGGF